MSTVSTSRSKWNAFAIPCFIASFCSIALCLVFLWLAYGQNRSEQRGRGLVIAAVVVMILRTIARVILASIVYAQDIPWWLQY